MTAFTALLAAAAAAMPHATVLQGREAAAVLRQCSRGAPAVGEAWFRPTAAQIDALDKAVIARLSVPGADPRITSVLDLRRAYRVEAVGIVRHGHRTVYGNYVPMRVGPGIGMATVVCDGGPAFFGAEIDEQGRLVRIDFNGPR